MVLTSGGRKRKQKAGAGVSSILVFLSLDELEKRLRLSGLATPSLRCTSLIGSLAGGVSLGETGEGERRLFPSRCRTSTNRVSRVSWSRFRTFKFLYFLTAAGESVEQQTCLSAGGRRGGLSVLRESLSFLLQQLPHVRHLGGWRGFGPALWSGAPDPVPAHKLKNTQKKQNEGEVKLNNIF